MDLDNTGARVEKKILISIKSVDSAKVRLRVSEKVGGNKKKFFAVLLFSSTTCSISLVKYYLHSPY